MSESLKGYPDPRVVLEETEVVDEVCSVGEPFPDPSTKVLTVEGVVGFDIMSSRRSTRRKMSGKGRVSGAAFAIT